jgi:hypothetical protein
MPERVFRPVVFAVLVFWVCPGCRPDSLKPAEYVQYIKKPGHGFVERQEDSGIFLEAFYQPPEYVALTRLKAENLNNSTLSEETNKSAAFYQFVLSVGSAKAVKVDEMLAKIADDGEPFGTKKQRMLYGLQNSFSLLAERDSLPCVFYHAQPSGNIDNAYHFILVFEPGNEKGRSEENLTLIYHDSIWLQKRLEFVFDKNKINQSPKLKL